MLQLLELNSSVSLLYVIICKTLTTVDSHNHQHPPESEPVGVKELVNIVICQDPSNEQLSLTETASDMANESKWISGCTAHFTCTCKVFFLSTYRYNLNSITIIWKMFIHKCYSDLGNLIEITLKNSCFLKIYIYIFNLKGRERVGQRPFLFICWLMEICPLFHCPNAHSSCGSTSLKLGARSSVQVSQLGGKKPSIWIISCYMYISRKL